MNPVYHLKRLYRAFLRNVPPSLRIKHLRTSRDFLFETDARHYFGQFGEDAVLQGYFTAKSWTRHGEPDRLENGFYVDIGAYHPSEYSNTFWFYKRGWRGINVDATPGTFELFHRRRPRDINLELAISEGADDKTMYMWESPFVVNTLSKEHANEWTERLGRPPREVSVPCRSLKSVLDQYLPSGTQVSFMNVDCEKHDLEVVRSGDWNRYRPELVLVEQHDPHILEILASPMHNFMTGVGYELQYWISPTLVYRSAETPIFC